jgi:hypothetical protein
MRNFILAIALLSITSCTKQGLHDKYQIPYSAIYKDAMHDGIVLVSCPKAPTQADAKVLVQKTIATLEGIWLDTATMDIIEVKKFDGDPSDAGYRDAGLSCSCDNSPAKLSVVK